MKRDKAPMSDSKALLIAVIILAIPIIALFKWAGSSPHNEDLKYSDRVVNSRVVNPSTLEIVYSVTNNSVNSRKISCDINVSDPGGTYKGGASYSSKNDIAPNATWDFIATVPVSNNGASYITKTSALCV